MKKILLSLLILSALSACVQGSAPEFGPAPKGWDDIRGGVTAK